MDRRLASDLQFDPGWVTDPAPPWVFRELPKDVLFELARIHAEFRVNVLRANLEAAERASEVLAKQR